jgi:hypothetical protein
LLPELECEEGFIVGRGLSELYRYGNF